MVFESIINPIKAEKKPWEMFFIGAVYSSIAILLGITVFSEYASLISIFFTVLATVPLMYATIKMEEKKDLEYDDEVILIKEHGKALSFFMFLFFGFVVSYALWFVFLPNDVSGSLFEIQTKEINNIRNTEITGDAVSLVKVFSSIFLNNLMVMLFSLLFAFFYGVGAIFILAWNASIIGAAIGEFVTSNIGTNYLASLSIGLMRYSLHGFPEMLAYFAAGMAGSIISIAIIRHDFGSGKFKKILVDSLDMIFLSVIVLFFAALIEVFVTPLLF